MNELKFTPIKHNPAREMRFNRVRNMEKRTLNMSRIVYAIQKRGWKL